jgi:spermidine dehydrogenase
MTDDLGMKAKIHRRDFLKAGALTAALPGIANASPAGTGYPPALTGLRGSHEGSFEAAHELGREGRDDWPAAAASEEYDLIVVGGGISGLAAAYYYRGSRPDARILILDNHDDFGGHAKRNEFQVNGRHLIGYGGSQTLEAPSAYSETASGLLRALSVDLQRFDQAFDQSFYERHGLGVRLYFDAATWGSDQLAPAGPLLQSGFLSMAEDSLSPEEALRQMPLTDAERSELEDLCTVREDRIPDVPLTEVIDFLSSISYETYLKEHVGLNSERLLDYFRPFPNGYWGVGTDAVSALECMLFGLPGLNKTGVPGASWLGRRALGLLSEPYIHHFPDGNSSIARGLVRSLIPEVSHAGNAEELVRSVFDYGQLDKPAHNVRIRLSSTALNVQNTTNGVRVFYTRNGQTFTATAGQAVLACYNMMIPHLCPELPLAQKKALKSLVKVPLVYSNVALTNWRALKRAGAGMVFTPNAFHQYFMIDFPVSMGGYRFAESEEEPVLLHFSCALTAPDLTPRDQHRVGRNRLLATPFEDIEQDLRQTLAGTLGPSGFDPAAEIAAITVNRWPHGYAYGYNPLFDPDYPPGEAPHEIGRTRFGNIAIANSDAGARAYLDEAINQAHRAVSELLG